MSDLKKIKRMVRVRIESVYSFANWPNCLTFSDVCIGSMYEVDSDTYILAYDEYLGENKRTVTMKICPTKNSVSMVYIGDAHMRDMFNRNQFTMGTVHYSGSVMPTRNYCYRTDFNITPEGGTIGLLYERWSGDVHLGYYSMDFQID